MPRSEGPPLKALANGATCTVQTYKNSVNSSVKATKKNGYGHLQNSDERSWAILALLFPFPATFYFQS